MSEQNGTVLFLRPSDLLSKWGFGDGDACQELLEGWASRSWAATRFEDLADPVHGYALSRVLLGELLREHLMPTVTLPDGVNLVHVWSSHNPFRVADDDGELPDMEFCDRLEAAPYVALPQKTVDEVCDRLFPERSAGWLALNDVLGRSYGFAEGLAPSDRGNFPAYPFLADGVLAVRLVVDALAGSLTEAGMLLAAEMIAGHVPSWDACSNAERDMLLFAARSCTAVPGGNLKQLEPLEDVCFRVRKELLENVAGWAVPCRAVRANAAVTPAARRVSYSGTPALLDRQ